MTSEPVVPTAVLTPGEAIGVSAGTAVLLALLLLL